MPDKNDRFASSSSATSSRKLLDDYQIAYAHAVIPCRIEAVSDDPVWSRIASATFGDVNVVSVANSPLRFEVNRDEAEQNEPALVLDLVLSGRYTHEQGDRVSVVSGGEAVITHSQLPFVAYSVDGSADVLDTRSLVLPERVLHGIGDISRLAGLRMTAELPELRLLPGYLAGLDGMGRIADGELAATVGRHVTELVVAALSRAMRREDPTEGRGMRAARLAAIKRAIDENLAQPTLNAVRVARHLGVTERYVQMLLEESGTTFSAYVMEKRLQVARQSLAVNREAGVTIRDIAWSSGFSDASHFTRVFRRRFGETPKAVRGWGSGEAAE